MKKDKTILDSIWDFFSSVKLTVYIFVLLAITSIIGTIILQNGSEQQYLRLYGEVFTKLIKALQFDDMYHAWWFLLLLAVLCINIVVCSVEKLLSTWKIIFPEKIKFNPERFQKQKNIQTFYTDEDYQSFLEKCEACFLKISKNKIIKKETESGFVIYTEKGRWTKLGVYVLHFSVLLLLIGALIGSLFGFKAHLNLDEGQKSNQAFISKTGKPVDIGFDIRCNEFEVRFYDTGAPEEFRSNLTIIENNKESFTKDIRVNHPLRYKGINIFQSSYGTAKPKKVTIDIIIRKDNSVIKKEMKIRDTIQLPDNQGKFLLEGFLQNFNFRGHSLGETFFGTITKENKEPLQIALPIKFPSFDKMRKDSLAFVVKDFEKKYYTGLQITKDPGVWYVYSSFILMIIGCLISFFLSFQSYFLEIEKGKTLKVSLAGISNKHKQGMKYKIKKIATKLKGN